MPLVSRPPTTMVFSALAAGGSSHSKVTPTRSSPRPSAYTISVADGSSETTHTVLANTVLANQAVRRCPGAVTRPLLGSLRAKNGDAAIHDCHAGRGAHAD